MDRLRSKSGVVDAVDVSVEVGFVPSVAPLFGGPLKLLLLHCVWISMHFASQSLHPGEPVGGAVS